MNPIQSDTLAASGEVRRSWLLLLFCILLPLYGLGWLIEAVWNRNGLNCDVPILLFIHQYATPARDVLMVCITHTGDVKAALVLAVLIFLVLMRKQTRHDAVFLACAVGGATLLDWFIKNAIQRVRPHLWASPAPEFDFSFPSGHSTGMMALTIALVVIAWRTRWRYAVIGFGAFYVGCVGFSRLYLGVHYPSDVLGGWALSFAWVSGMIFIRQLPAEPSLRFKAGARFCGGLIAGLLVVLAGYVSSDLAHHNLRVVAAGQAYRSGQMDADALAHCIKTYGIKSILNLRGKNPVAGWYQAEIATAAKLNVVHYDWSFGSGDQLMLKQMHDLTALLRRAPKPVLIHCEGGADRSGLASALYCFAIEGRKPVAADRQLSIWNGHVPLIRPKVIAMDDSFWRYVRNDNSRAKRIENPVEPVIKQNAIDASSLQKIRRAEICRAEILPANRRPEDYEYEFDGKNIKRQSG